MGNQLRGAKGPKGSLKETEEHFASFIRSVRSKGTPADERAWKRCKQGIARHIRALKRSNASAMKKKKLNRKTDAPTKKRRK